MDGNAAFRRAMHIVSPIFLSYYLLPEQLGAGITRTSVTLLFLGTAACIEIARIALGARAWSWQFLFGVLATGSAMIVEGPKHAQLDDDLLMLVVPLTVLTLAVLIFQPPMLP